MNNRKRKHHYVPRLYLEGFCDENEMIWTYKKADPETPYSQKPENVAYENYFYSLEGEGVDVDVFENSLADIIESPATEPLKCLRSAIPPSFDDRQQLSMFFGFMLIRTPSYRSHINTQINHELNARLRLVAQNIERFAEWCDVYKKLHDEPIAENIEELRKAILSGKYNIELTKNYSLLYLQKLAFSVGELLASMTWTIITIAEVKLYFLTSDNPMIVENSNNHGFYSPGLTAKGLKIYVPLSKNTCLLMKRESSSILSIKIASASARSVGEINKAIIINSNRYIYAGENRKDIKKLIYDNRNDT